MKKNKIRRPQNKATTEPLTISDDRLARNEKIFCIFSLSILFTFALYQAVVYFGHQVVPNSDFPAFTDTARSILKFRLPETFKRLPVLGILHIALSKVVGTNHPELTAGWVLNSICHCANIVLLYLIARKLLGKAAIWFTLIAALNPWMLALLVDPIIETTLVFFILLTLYFMVNRSNLCYLFAALASMTRYEGAALIFAAFVIDMIVRKTKKERLTALAYSALASLPLALWLLATKLNWKPGTSHYVAHFTSERGHIGLEYFRYLWETTFMPLFQLPSYAKALLVEPVAQNSAEAASIQSALKTLFSVSRVVAVFGFVVAIPTAIIKRRWDFIAILIFLLCYVGAHSMRHVTLHRYTVPVIWITLLLCCYGLQTVLKLICKEGLIPRPLRISMGAIVAIVSGIWLIKLLPILPKTAPQSIHSQYMPYIAMGIVVLTLGVLIYLYRTKDLARNIAISVLVCLMIVSNQFVLARQVGNGTKDAEFKMLADWYLENAKPGERMMTTMPHVVSLFAPEHKKAFRHTGGTPFRLETIQEFTKVCYEKNITYVVWDSRVGFIPRDSYYQRWKMQKIDPLKNPRDLGPYEFITQIKASDLRFLNIFRLRAQQQPDQKQDQ